MRLPNCDNQLVQAFEIVRIVKGIDLFACGHGEPSLRICAWRQAQPVGKGVQDDAHPHLGIRVGCIDDGLQGVTDLLLDRGSGGCARNGWVGVWIAWNFGWVDL